MLRLIEIIYYKREKADKSKNDEKIREISCCGIDLFETILSEKDTSPTICFSLFNEGFQIDYRRSPAMKYITNVLKLMLLTNKVYEKDRYSVMRLANYLTLIRSSTFYPYNFNICVYHKYDEPFSEEEALSNKIALINRLAKSDIKVLSTPKSESSISFVKFHLNKYNLDNQNDVEYKNMISAIAAITTAGFLSSEARVGYYLSILSAQSLVYMLSLISKSGNTNYLKESILQGFSALTSYIYTLYHKRLSGKEPELYRHIIPAPPRFNLDWRRLYNELYTNLGSCSYSGCLIGKDIDTTLNSIRQISMTIKNTVNELLKDMTDVNLEKEVVLGRFQSYDKIKDAVKYSKYDLTVMFATEQWSPLHSLIGRLTVRDGGRLLVLYTQSSLTSTITTILVERDLVEKQSSDSVGVSYVPVSITDAFVAENVGKIIDGYIRDHFGDKRVRGLVLAMGPASLSVPLYMYGLGREEEGWRSFIF